MSECMAFPATPAEFIEQYSFQDKERIYTNGSELIAVFRVKQLLAYYYPTSFAPGDEVWVVERDEDGNACDVVGFLFVAEVAGAVICTPKVYSCDSLEEILDYHIQQTAEDYETGLSVFPAKDCYKYKQYAKEVCMRKWRRTEP